MPGTLVHNWLNRCICSIVNQQDFCYSRPSKKCTSSSSLIGAWDLGLVVWGLGSLTRCYKTARALRLLLMHLVRGIARWRPSDMFLWHVLGHCVFWVRLRVAAFGLLVRRTMDWIVLSDAVARRPLFSSGICPGRCGMVGVKQT